MMQGCKKAKHANANHPRPPMGLYDIWPNPEETRMIVGCLMRCLHQIQTPEGKAAYIEAHGQWRSGFRGQRTGEKI